MIKRLSFIFNAAIFLYFFVAFVVYDLQWWRHLADMNEFKRLVFITFFCFITWFVYKFCDDFF